MARKSSLDPDSLAGLGVETLARLVSEEAAANAAFRKIVKAALAGREGPEAVAKLIDRRLAALEKARGFIDWQKGRAFREDLAATLATIAGELAQASPAMAAERLLRFLATHETVFERVDDSSGRVQVVYANAVAVFGTLAARLAPPEADTLPEAVMARLGNSAYGYLIDVAIAIIPHLAPTTLTRWDATLEAAGRALEAQAPAAARRHGFAPLLGQQWLEVRQRLAAALGNLDGLVALEARKHPNLQDPVGIAEQLLAAGRAAEALDWVRREGSAGHLRMMTAQDIADENEPRDPLEPRRVLVEARILEALARGAEAQALRWSAFEATLDASILRAHVAALPDFEDFAVLDRAFAHALASPHAYHALVLLLEWPRLDEAARLVKARAGIWDGRYYDILAPAADRLEDAHPLEATILLRALTEAILDRAHSKAYPHAARYLRRIAALVPRIDATAWPQGLETYPNWRAGIDTTHARKSAFWAALEAAHER